MADTILNDDPLWYKDAVIYQLHVKAFGDSNADGYGDFSGLTDKLDYIQELGVSVVWLLPFYPSPLRDDGYDIADYRNVHPDYGTRRDFKIFVREAHRRGLKVITELVINHTSDQNPWFQAARRAPRGSTKRNFYVWSDDDQKFPETRIIFTDTETSNWAWDPVAKQYYWHRFFSHQPDLNFGNPEVVKAVIRLMRFWLDQGVDGLRLDAIPYLCVREGTNNENLPETHAVLKQMRKVVDEHYSNRMFLAEANQWPEDVREYFGDDPGNECHMAFHFPLMPRMYMALAQEDRYPVVEIMQQTPEIPANCQWAIFLRNHDELTLEMVTDRERDYMYRTYAADPRARVNVGIRRRLAPLLDNDPSRIKLMNSLLLSMPGSPVIYYGDEIGMGDNIYLGDRNGVRTPMQWSPDRNAGFSKADPQRLYLPPVMDPVYGYQGVNVEAQARDPSSLLNWMRRMIAVRKRYRAFGRGSLKFLNPGNRKILAYVREYGDEAILCVANLGRTAQPVELDLSAYQGRVPVELLGRTSFPPVGELPYLLTLAEHGFHWFRLDDHAEVPAWHEQWLAPDELPTLVLFDGWESFFPDRHSGSRRQLSERLCRQLAGELIPGFVEQQRWFAAKGEAVTGGELVSLEPWRWGDRRWLLAVAELALASGARQRYFLPLAIAWEEPDDGRGRGAQVLAKVRQQNRVGVLYDGFVDEYFGSALLAALAQAGPAAPAAGGPLRFTATRALAEFGADLPPPSRAPAEGSNSALVFGDRLFLKVYRRLRQGENLELEVGRFLAQHGDFDAVAPLFGAVEFGDRYTLALLQGYSHNQGDAWHYTLDYLQRFLDDQALLDGADQGDPHAVYALLAETLGRRTAELHLALCCRPDEPAFAAEPFPADELRAWAEQVAAEARAALAKLSQAELDKATRPYAQALQAAADDGRLERALAPPEAVDGLWKTRYHGDYHLGQVLIAGDDVVIVDFEGEPDRPPAERRRKRPPLKDVAGMLRSFDYAAAVAAEAADVSPGRLEAWRGRAADTFLTAYRDTLLASDSGLWPPPDQAEALLRLALLEKAFYELSYEIDHRPAWVGVPLRGLLALLNRETLDLLPTETRHD